jgi:hypothetical protein
MTSCLMILLTGIGLPVAAVAAAHLYAAVRRRMGSMRIRIPAILPTFRRLAPAVAAAALVATVGLGLAYGWSEAKPCGGQANAALDTPSSRLLACR